MIPSLPLQSLAHLEAFLREHRKRMPKGTKLAPRNPRQQRKLPLRAFKP